MLFVTPAVLDQWVTSEEREAKCYIGDAETQRRTVNSPKSTDGTFRQISGFVTCVTVGIGARFVDFDLLARIRGAYEKD